MHSAEELHFMSELDSRLDLPQLPSTVGNKTNNNTANNSDNRSLFIAKMISCHFEQAGHHRIATTLNGSPQKALAIWF